MATRVIADRYALRDQLGRGGMGTVWRADDLYLERPVAVKEVFQADPTRLLREGRAAARLSHPAAVTVFDVLEEDGNAYLVMELVDAVNLSELIVRDGPLAPERVAQIGLSLLDALAAAHAQGIVHRDVKPANVMVRADGTVKLADFGIASVTDLTHITAVGMVLGSPNYMSPEQAQGHDIGPTADLWSLGSTLYYAVEGEPPFARTEAIAVLTAVVNSEPRPPVRAGAALGPVLMALMAKEPSARPVVAEARRALTAAAAPAPAVAASAPAAAAVAPAPRSLAPERGSGPHWGANKLAVAIALAVLLAAAGLVAAFGTGHGKAKDAATTSKAAGTQAASPAAGPASGAGTAAVPAGWVSYRDPTTGFAIAHPAGWQVSQHDRTITDFRDPVSHAYLRVDWTDKPGPSAEAAWRQQAASFGPAHAGYRELGIQATQYKGFSAATWEYGYDESGAHLHAVDLGMVTGRYGFALNFQTAEQDWTRLQPVFDSFKTSFAPPA